MEFELKNGAIFVTDAHENSNHRNFRRFLELVRGGEISVSQLFFLGDMFDFLTDADFTRKFFKFEINLINEIAENHEIYYFEGNHDFNLERIFPKCKVFPNALQPANFGFLAKNEQESESNEISVQIAHGDIFLPKFTQIFLLSLRNKRFIKFMNFIDKSLNFAISKQILNSQTKKILYKEAENFEDFISPKIANYSANFVIEGHYHQGKTLEFERSTYINLKALALNSSYYKLKINENKIIFQEMEFF